MHDNVQPQIINQLKNNIKCRSMQEIDKILTKILLEEPLSESEKQALLIWEKETDPNHLMIKQIKGYW